MTGEGGIRFNVKTIHSGASDYLSKTFDTEKMAYNFNEAVNRRKNVRLNQHNREKEKNESTLTGQN